MNPDNQSLAKVLVSPENPLKEMFVEYVGKKFVTDEDEGEFEVTIEMIVETLAHEFPEFLLVMAEENWVRGYKQGLEDASRLHQAPPKDA